MSCFNYIVVAARFSNELSDLIRDTNRVCAVLDSVLKKVSGFKTIDGNRCVRRTPLKFLLQQLLEVATVWRSLTGRRRQHDGDEQLYGGHFGIVASQAPASAGSI